MSARIAFAHLGQTHDEFPAVSTALTARGIDCELVHLDHLDSFDRVRYAALNVRECRGYHLDERFLEKLEAMARRTPSAICINPLGVARGTLDKATYLPELAASGIELVPTHWIAAGADWTLESVMHETGWSDLVVKPCVSSKSWRTFRLRRTPTGLELFEAGMPARPALLNAAAATAILRLALAGRSVCVQRFLPEIQRRGEVSFVFLGGTFSHAVRKTVAAGGWLAHEFYGGRNAVCEVDAADLAWAEQVYGAIAQRFGELHYGRVDAIPDGRRWRLLECELVVPRLFLREGQAVERYAAVLAAVIETK
jgi:glutathione synthase/RimK-type ligase-like ATP-grasp enzyme